MDHQITVLFHGFLNSWIRDSTAISPVKIRLRFLNDRFAHERAKCRKLQVIKEIADKGSETELQNEGIDKNDRVLGSVECRKNCVEGCFLCR
jgi:hypothetical protein